MKCQVFSGLKGKKNEKNFHSLSTKVAYLLGHSVK